LKFLIGGIDGDFRRRPSTGVYALRAMGFPPAAHAVQGTGSKLEVVSFFLGWDEMLG